MYLRIFGNENRQLSTLCPSKMPSGSLCRSVYIIICRVARKRTLHCQTCHNTVLTTLRARMSHAYIFTLLLLLLLLIIIIIIITVIIATVIIIVIFWFSLKQRVLVNIIQIFTFFQVSTSFIIIIIIYYCYCVCYYCYFVFSHRYGTVNVLVH